MAFCLAKCDIISKADCKLFMQKFEQVAKDDGKLELHDLLASDLMEAEPPLAETAATQRAAATTPLRPEESVL